MEELQLSLTPTRVEQRNFGIWLKSWQVGQTLQALVTDKLPSQQLVLKINNHQITATTDIPVQKGAVLMLEVSGFNSMPVLKILSSDDLKNVPPTPLDEPLQQQRQQLLARQNSVAKSLGFLLDWVAGANNLALGSEVQNIAKNIKNNLHKWVDIGQYKAVQNLIYSSGIFFEAYLKQRSASGDSWSGFDLKSELLKLLEAINRYSISESKNQSLQMQTEELTQVLKKQIEGALANISLKQMSALDASKTDALSWYFEVPFAVGESLHNLTILIEQEARREIDSESNDRWKVLLNIDIEPLGNVDVSLTLKEKRLWIIFVAEQQNTASLFAKYSQELKEGLARGGLDAVVIRSERGIGQMPFHRPVSGPGVDEMA